MLLFDFILEDYNKFTYIIYYMKRKVEKDLEKWVARKNRKPLIIRGARQVGKSTLVRKFSILKNYNLFEVNLERNVNLKLLFKNFNLKELINEIEIICEKRGLLKEEKSILFLDEIQAIPEAIPALRYFYEEYPNLKVIAAGSLFEFVLSKHSFSMPVGRVEYLFMYPMTFEELLEAKNETFLLNYIKEYDFVTPFSKTAHEKLLSIQRDFFIVGGMPEAVQLYINNENYEEISAVHSSILETYIDDFAKYAKGETLQILQKVFNFVGSTPSQKIKYANIDSNLQARELKKSIQLLEKAKVIFPVYHSSGSGIPLSVTKNNKIYKLFFLDIGLMNKISKIKHISLEDIKEDNFINKGVISEQYIAQELLNLEPKNETPELYYWLREGKSNNAEIDFITQVKNEIIPIEVKAGKTGTLKSLHRFIYEKKGSKTAIRFDANLPSIQKISTKIANLDENQHIEYDIISLPFYMVGEAYRFIHRLDKVARNT